MLKRKNTCDKENENVVSQSSPFKKTKFDSLNPAMLISSENQENVIEHTTNSTDQLKPAMQKATRLEELNKSMNELTSAFNNRDIYIKSKTNFTKL